ncbi:hypothetical protein PVOR_08045 [Paenibacillus vortex V453]|uniref:Uncharacterized protein n=1 Tax=Paenibacillus vortex V453 TaxID=715225 RepID=A0A2R9SXX5_9BACL|nr:hypothetical protein PVOR_08045 [Paenibacillus vortex V453]
MDKAGPEGERLYLLFQEQIFKKFFSSKYCFIYRHDIYLCRNDI